MTLLFTVLGLFNVAAFMLAALMVAVFSLFWLVARVVIRDD